MSGAKGRLSMTVFRALSAMVLAVSALATGCSDADGGAVEIGAVDIDDPLYSTMAGPGGSEGTNGLTVPCFHDNKYALYRATTQSLALFNGWWWNFSSSNSGSVSLRSTPCGKEDLSYAVKTALIGSVYDAGVAYPGEHYLNTTTSWKTQPLTTPQAEDLFAAVLAHVNAFGFNVDINLSGPNVFNNPNVDPTEFIWDEALWIADINLVGGDTIFNFHVWPLTDYLDDNCQSVDKLKYRVCGSMSAAQCRLVPRMDLTTACNESADGWRCIVNGVLMPAIKTRLRVIDAHSMYWGFFKGPPACP
jgi:hypothetical protein